jgi:predicted unusual protein kinase regulating ubiquinone biosynthesis (AarF/ABC1/UbiB family)
MVAQIDLRFEARNMRRFARNFANDRRIRFARPLAPSLCHSSVLVQSFEHGYRAQNVSAEHRGRYAVDGGRAAQGDCARGRVGVPAHDADAQFCARRPAPGQHFGGDAVDERVDVRLVLLDCGLVSELSDRDNENFIALFTALCDGDAEHGAELMIERARFIDEQMRVTTAASARWRGGASSCTP